MCICRENISNARSHSVLSQPILNRTRIQICVEHFASIVFSPRASSSFVSAAEIVNVFPCTGCGIVCFPEFFFGISLRLPLPKSPVHQTCRCNATAQCSLLMNVKCIFSARHAFAYQKLGMRVGFICVESHILTIRFISCMRNSQ